MDARQIRSAPVPLLALGMIPQRADELPTLPAVGRAEQPAGQRPAPDVLLAAGGQRPDARGAPVDRTAPRIVLLVALRLGRIGRCRDFLPAVGRGTVELDPEMAMVERRIAPTVAPVGQREGDVVAEEI